MGGWGISFTCKNSLVSSEPHRSKRAGLFAKELQKSQKYFTTVLHMELASSENHHKPHNINPRFNNYSI